MGKTPARKRKGSTKRAYGFDQYADRLCEAAVKQIRARRKEIGAAISQVGFAQLGQGALTFDAVVITDDDGDELQVDDLGVDTGIIPVHVDDVADDDPIEAWFAANELDDPELGWGAMLPAALLRVEVARAAGELVDRLRGAKLAVLDTCVAGTYDDEGEFSASADDWHATLGAKIAALVPASLREELAALCYAEPERRAWFLELVTGAPKREAGADKPASEEAAPARCRRLLDEGNFEELFAFGEDIIDGSKHYLEVAAYLEILEYLGAGYIATDRREAALSTYGILRRRHFPAAIETLERIAAGIGQRFATGAAAELAREVIAMLTVTAKSVSAPVRKRARSWWDALDEAGTEWKPAFLAALGIDRQPTDDDITTMTLLGAFELEKTVDAKGNRRRALITSVAPLRALSLLENLEVNCFGGVTDWPLLAELPRLRDLAIHFALYDASPLASLRELVRLDLRENALPTLAPLGTLAKLERLRAPQNKLTSIAGVEGMTSLRALTLDFNDDLADLAPLAGHRTLEVLDCTYTRVADLRPLRELPALRKVNLRDTEVRDLSPLARCSALETVACSAGRQTKGLLELAALPRLKLLIVGAEARRSDVAAFRNKRPDVEVR